jgi:hypothetical protein
LDVQTNAVRSI